MADADADAEPDTEGTEVSDQISAEAAKVHGRPLLSLHFLHLSFLFISTHFIPSLPFPFGF